MSGTIIVIEGTDGSGKKTQTNLLAENLKNEGFNVLVHSFPSYDSLSSGPVKLYLGGDLGENANSVSAKQASVLFATDRVATFLDKKNNLKEHYENGGVIIFDRYVYSNMIHQACKIKDREKIDEFVSWLCKLEFEDLSLPKADLIFFLDMPVDFSKKLANARETLKAGTKTDIHETDANHLTSAYSTAKYVATKYAWTQISCIENGQIKTPEQIAFAILNVTKNFLNGKKQKS